MRGVLLALMTSWAFVSGCVREPTVRRPTITLPAGTEIVEMTGAGAAVWLYLVDDDGREYLAFVDNSLGDQAAVDVFPVEYRDENGQEGADLDG